MSTNNVRIAALLFICLIGQASSQGYMGTMSTGTGILSPLTVGKSTSSAANVGASASMTDLTGSWSLDLKGSEIRHLDLQIFQKGGLILGSGTMIEGRNSLPMTAAGSMTGSSPTIFVSLFDNSEVFMLELSASGNALAGKYESLSLSGEHGSGTVTGNVALSLSSSQNLPNALGANINPSATSGAWVGKSAQDQTIESRSNNLIEKRSVYKSSTGQGTANYDGSQVTTSYGQ